MVHNIEIRHILGLYFYGSSEMVLSEAVKVKPEFVGELKMQGLGDTCLEALLTGYENNPQKREKCVVVNTESSWVFEVLI